MSLNLQGSGALPIGRAFGFAAGCSLAGAPGLAFLGAVEELGWPGGEELEDEDDVEELGWPGGEPASKVPPGYPMAMGALAIGPCVQAGWPGGGACVQCPVPGGPCHWAAAGVAFLWGPAEAAPGGGSLGGAGMPGGLCVCCKWGIIAGMPGGRTGPL